MTRIKGLTPAARYTCGAAILLFASSCGGSTDPDDGPISGFVRTLQNGVIVEEDVQDWQPRMQPRSGGGGGVVVTPDTTFAFSPAVPNPAQSNTDFRCAVLQNAHVTVWVTDGNGKRERTLIDGLLVAGEHTFGWDLNDDSGNPVPNGLYRVRFQIKHGRDSTVVKSFGDVMVER